jgi:hypothetical protein
MVRRPPSAPAGPHRSVFRYVRMRTEDVSRRTPYQPRPAFSYSASASPGVFSFFTTTCTPS